jgi:hygromycin-B 7''-O-kinase
LPEAASEAAWDALLADDSALAAGVAAIAARHGLSGASAHRYGSGSMPVYALGQQHVLKIFPPHEAAHADVEARVLGFVAGKLPLPTPAVTAADALEGWRYILMTQLRGQRLVDAWPTLSIDERDRLADDLGEGLAALHALDISGLAPIEPRWDEFIARQIPNAVERQRQRGLAPHWLEQIPAFLDRWQPPAGGARALLHTEVMREHLLVEPTAHGWRLSGWFDFEPAMVGDPDYEFASVGLFVACGDGRTLRRILRAYGHADADADADGAAALACRFMAHALLHRYSNLPWYLRRLPPDGEITLEQLARQWWGLA